MSWRKKPFLISLLFVLIFFCGCFPGHRLVREKTVKIAILPDFSLPMMTQKYTPLMEYLSKETGLRVEYVSCLSYSNFLSTVEGSKADFSFQNPLFYILLAKTKKAYPVAEALTLQRESRSRGVIIVRRDSEIETVEDLKGKRIMIPSRRAVLGYLAQRQLCREHNFDPEKEAEIVLGHRHDEVVRNVALGEVDAGFVKEGALSGAESIVDVSKIKIIAETNHFPNWCFVAFPQTKKRVVEKIKMALLKLDIDNPEHRERVLEPMRVGGFVEVSEDAYRIVSRTIKELKLPY